MASGLLRSLLLVVGLLATPAMAQDWPTGTIRLIVPFTAGGPVDFPARLLIDRLATQTKGVFIIENRAGAGGSVGLQSVVQSDPDGRTLLLTTSSIAMVPSIYPKLNFDPVRDLTLLSLVTEVPISIAVRSDSPIKDINDLIAKAKAAPGKITFGSGGVGTGNHLAGELFKKMASVSLQHIPYRGTSQSLTGLYAKDIDMVFVSAVEIMPHVRDGNVRVLGVGTPNRIPELPDVPAVSEVLPGYAMTNWYGLFGPKNIAPAIVERIRTEIRTAKDDAVLKEKAAGAGMTLQLTEPDKLRERLDVEVPRWKQLIPEIGLKVE
ncbi:MFS transporter [Afipia sp. P52-10]|jgi:tripartite-type tricarboxylate transporter receptor subunit TctC|uniref:Bug family tripartite tricarboxylate transporter substrate binding protein n=1 Tax=Afipia sp. P52-10 TaxID=1429916 RepID=UPI0003DF4024|nr:tripartite tricarboxylate transporter substrate binding protein [Afipia sp. P52-10]ETR78021.1 MFS transporter [Afipia sp. P52-10]